MRTIAEFTKTTLIGGVLVLIPIYLSVLLLLKALGGIVGLVAPITAGFLRFRTPRTKVASRMPARRASSSGLRPSASPGG
jgi:hypothetical protein